MPSQYIRTCKSCGQVWYSLVSRENKLTSKKTSYKVEVCWRTCDVLDCGGRGKAQRNRDAVDSELTNLRRCPKCGSSNYNQEIEKFKK